MIVQKGIYGMYYETGSHYWSVLGMSNGCLVFSRYEAHSCIMMYLIVNKNSEGSRQNGASRFVRGGTSLRLIVSSKFDTTFTETEDLSSRLLLVCKCYQSGFSRSFSARWELLFFSNF
jgi:hypothetical protein